MIKWLLVGTLSIFGVGWLVVESLPASHSAAAAPAPAEKVAANDPAPARATPFVQRARAPEAAAPSVTKLAPGSEGLRRRLDDQIPARLSAEAAHCYHAGLPPDGRFDVTYHLRIRGGDVSIASLSANENTLGDGAAERCIHDRILAAKWHDDELPDLEEDDDLYLRAGALERALATASP
jgi:hypothetical protein